MLTQRFLTRQGGRHVLEPEVAYLRDGHESQVSFSAASRVPFESCVPVRLFPSWRGKRNYSGSYWSSTMQRHVGFESLYERTALMVLDRELSVVAISSQPMWIFWPAGSSQRSHAPDFFIRHNNGDGEIVDVRPFQRIDEAATAIFAATRELCNDHGFRYRVMSDLDRTLDQNLRFLSRYRDNSWKPPLETVARVSELLDRPLRIRFLRSALAQTAPETATLGWIYWLLWAGVLNTDLRTPIGLDTIVTTTVRARS